MATRCGWRTATVATVATAAVLLFLVLAFWCDYEMQRPAREAKLAQELRDIDHIVEAVLRYATAQQGCSLNPTATGGTQGDHDEL